MPRERRAQDRRSGKKDRRGNKDRRGQGNTQNFSGNQQAKNEGQLPQFKRAAPLEPMNQ